MGPRVERENLHFSRLPVSPAWTTPKAVSLIRGPWMQQLGSERPARRPLCAVDPGQRFLHPPPSRHSVFESRRSDPPSITSGHPYDNSTLYDTLAATPTPASPSLGFFASTLNRSHSEMTSSLRIPVPCSWTTSEGSSPEPSHRAGLPKPRFWTSGLEDCERIIAAGLRHPVRLLL